MQSLINCLFFNGNICSCAKLDPESYDGSFIHEAATPNAVYQKSQLVLIQSHPRHLVCRGWCAFYQVFFRAGPELPPLGWLQAGLCLIASFFSRVLHALHIQSGGFLQTTYFPGFLFLNPPGFFGPACSTWCTRLLKYSVIPSPYLCIQVEMRWRKAPCSVVTLQVCMQEKQFENLLFFIISSPLNTASFWFASLSRVETAQTKAFLTLRDLHGGWRWVERKQARINAKGTITKEIKKKADWRSGLRRI